MVTDEKCKATILPEVPGCEALRLVILDTDDGWDTFLYHLQDQQWQKEIQSPDEPLYDPTVPTEEAAKRTVISRGIKLRRETLDSEQLKQKAEEYLAGLEWEPFNRSLLPSHM